MNCMPPSVVPLRRRDVFCSWLVGRVVRDVIYERPAARRVLKHVVAAASHDRAITREIAGQTLAIEPSQSIVELRMSICRAYEPAMTRYMASSLRPGMSVADVGAHIGFFTLLASEKVGPSGTVVACEPNPRNYERLLHNIQLNCRSNIRALSVALSDDVGELQFTSADDSAFSSLAGAAMTANTTVRSSTLDRELATLGIDNLDFIKIDIEGAELLALRGMDATLRQNPNIQLVIEVHPSLIAELGGTPDQLVRLLRAHSFTLYKLDAEGHPKRIPATSTFGNDETAGYLVCRREPA